MKVSAYLRHLNISPRKVRIVVDTLRGLGAAAALSKLEFTQKRAAGPLTKLLNSAIANAENNFSLDKKTLLIDEFRVDGGPILKRFRPKSRGMAAPIWHRTSHITIILEGKRAVGAKAKHKKQEISDSSPNVSVNSQSLPVETNVIDSVRSEEPSRAGGGFEVEKKVGQARKPSFVKRFFRRKSI